MSNIEDSILDYFPEDFVNEIKDEIPEGYVVLKRSTDPLGVDPELRFLHSKGIQFLIKIHREKDGKNKLGTGNYLIVYVKEADAERASDLLDLFTPRIANESQSSLDMDQVKPFLFGLLIVILFLVFLIFI